METIIIGKPDSFKTTFLIHNFLKCFSYKSFLPKAERCFFFSFQDSKEEILERMAQAFFLKHHNELSARDFMTFNDIVFEINSIDEIHSFIKGKKVFAIFIDGLERERFLRSVFTLRKLTKNIFATFSAPSNSRIPSIIFHFGRIVVLKRKGNKLLSKVIKDRYNGTLKEEKYIFISDFLTLEKFEEDKDEVLIKNLIRELEKEEFL